VGTGLRERLANLRASCVAFYGLGVDAFHPVMVRPSLGFAMVPKPRARRSAAESERTPEARKREAIARALDPGRAAAAGLVDGAKLDATGQKPSQRQGLHGLSAAGASTVEDLCSLVRQDRGLYAIWTVTLDPSVALVLDRMDLGAQRFGDAIRRRFGEALRRACAREAVACRVPIPDHFWFVVEPQKQGRPHWHFVFRCKARRGRRWLLGKGQLDRLIAGAFRTVAGVSIPARSAGNVQALRSDPGRYLSKYLRKGQGRTGADAVTGNGWSLNLVPLRWWGCSRSALALLRQYRFPLPSLAVGWLSRQWPALAAIGALEARLWQPEADGAPTIVCGRWLGIQGLEEVMGHLFGLANRAYDCGRTFGYT
jgi:hypothetical protein